MFCVFYFISAFAVDLLIILSISKDVDIYNRILAFIFLLVALPSLFFINYSLSKISVEAHRPYNKLNSIIARKPATTVLNLKVLSLIEKLSGPVISIYCLDIFPFTNYEFYLHMAYCAQNFMLLNHAEAQTLDNYTWASTGGGGKGGSCPLGNSDHTGFFPFIIKKS